jgi:hypothetical protein
MGQFNCFWPERSESQKRQRENAKKIQISDTGFWKGVLQRFLAPQKVKKSAQMRPDGKRKSCAAQKIILREQTGARMRPDRKKIVLRWLTAARKRPDRPKGKKFCAPCHPDTSAQKWLDRKKIPCCAGGHSLCRCDRSQKKLLRGLTQVLGYNRTAHKKSARPAAKWMRPVKKKDSARLTLLRGCDRSVKKIINLHGLTLTLQLGCDQTAPKKDSARLEKVVADRPARTGLRGQTCADRSETGSTGQRPVQPVFNAGSTGFGQDGPGKIWLKAAELKFSSEVQLASSSW